jgi:hypothetical protein
VSAGLRHWQRRQRDDGGRGGERRVELSAQHCSFGSGLLQLRGGGLFPLLRVAKLRLKWSVWEEEEEEKQGGGGAHLNHLQFGLQQQQLLAALLLKNDTMRQNNRTTKRKQ